MTSAISPGVVPPVPLPLPPGWTEHTSPTGHTYYFHAQTNQSTYVRPFPSVPVPSTSSQPPVAPGKKEKPVLKTPIPGTSWLRVKTNAGNVFFTHKEKKESVWEVPEEIAHAVEELEREEAEAQQLKEVEERIAKLKSDLKEDRSTASAGAKRKAAEPEVPKGKKAKVESMDDNEGVRAAEDKAATPTEEQQKPTRSQSPSRDIEMKDSSEGTASAAGNGTKDLPKDYSMPAQVNLSPEEARALFKTLLQEKDISPLTPYDSAIPLLVKDPRYVLLPSLSDRHAAFNEYCLEKSRSIRAAKQQASSSAATTDGASSSTSDSKAKTKEAYEGLLKDELKSTRTTWDEFRRKWKKDRRFFGFGRDDKEREKIFKEWRNTLGERKRKEAELAEANFYALLREHKQLVTAESKDGADPMWKDVKRHKSIYSDPRYDAVGSSSLREELFAAYLKAQANQSATTTIAAEAADKTHEGENDEETKKRLRQERAEKATKERQEQVRREKERVGKQIDRSKGSLTHENAVEEYMTLLTDAIRESTATYQSSVELLSRSPIFARSSLPTSQRINLFNSHTAKLRDKQLAALYALFEAHTPGLDGQFKDIPPSIGKSAPAIKLGLEGDEREIRRIYDAWQEDRNKRARKEFDELLSENQFVEFWGGLAKQAKEKEGQGSGTIIPGVDAVDDGDEEDQEGEGGGGKADLKALAKGIGGRQIEDVLKHDRRYKVFDHVPEQRVRWIQDYIARMAAPKLSVHVPNDTTMSNQPFHELPEAILLHILCVTAVLDVLSLRQTCRLFYKLSQERSVWTSALHEFEDDRIGYKMRLEHPLATYSTKELRAIVLRKAHLEMNWTSPKPKLRRRRTIKEAHYVDVLLVPGGRWFLTIRKAPLGAITAWDLESNKLEYHPLIAPLGGTVPRGQWVEPVTMFAAVDDSSPHFAFDLVIAYEYSEEPHYPVSIWRIELEGRPGKLTAHYKFAMELFKSFNPPGGDPFTKNFLFQSNDSEDGSDVFCEIIKWEESSSNGSTHRKCVFEISNSAGGIEEVYFTHDETKVLVLTETYVSIYEIPPLQEVPKAADPADFKIANAPVWTQRLNPKAEYHQNISPVFLSSNVDEVRFSMFNGAAGLEFNHVKRPKGGIPMTGSVKARLSPNMQCQNMGLRRAVQTSLEPGEGKLLHCVTYFPRPSSWSELDVQQAGYIQSEGGDWVVADRRCVLEEDVGESTEWQFDEYSGRIILRFEDEGLVSILDFSDLPRTYRSSTLGGA